MVHWYDTMLCCFLSDDNIDMLHQLIEQIEIDQAASTVGESTPAADSNDLTLSRKTNSDQLTLDSIPETAALIFNAEKDQVDNSSSGDIINMSSTTTNRRREEEEESSGNEDEEDSQGSISK